MEEYEDVMLMIRFGWSEHEINEMSPGTRNKLMQYLYVQARMSE